MVTLRCLVEYLSQERGVDDNLASYIVLASHVKEQKVRASFVLCSQWPINFSDSLELR